MLDLPDEEQNRAAFGIPGTSRGGSTSPKARLTLLFETGTGAALAWRAGPIRGESEHSQAEALLGHLEPGTLVLADRDHFWLSLWSKSSETGADLLWRMPTNARMHPTGEIFEDGSWSADLRESGSNNRRSRGACRVRVVEYRLSDRPGETHRLATTLFDFGRFPAHELASLFHERWEIENAHDEVKTHLLGPGATLRSKTPELVLQEIDGLMLAHYAVRCLINRGGRNGRDASERKQLRPFRSSSPETHSKPGRRFILTLDELGWVPFAVSGGRSLFDLVGKLYERTSIILPTNLA